MIALRVFVLGTTFYYLIVAETSSTAGRLWRRDDVGRLYNVTSNSAYVTTHDDVSSPLDCSRLCKESETCEFFLYSKTDRRCVVACPSPCWRASVGKGGTYALYMLSTAFRDTTRCPVDSLNYQFFPGTGSCLRVNTITMRNQPQQQVVCQNEGAHLLYINTQLEYDLLQHMIHAVAGVNLGTTAFVGGSLSSGSWTWGDGTAATTIFTSHLCPGELTGGEYCMGLNLFNLCFGDLPCGSSYYSVCEIDL